MITVTRERPRGGELHFIGGEGVGGGMEAWGEVGHKESEIGGKGSGQLMTLKPGNFLGPTFSACDFMFKS